jgi:hypothetical protein
MTILGFIDNVDEAGAGTWKYVAFAIFSGRIKKLRDHPDTGDFSW